MTRRYDPKRKVRAAAHAKRAHTCPHCLRVYFGNGFTNHKRACAMRAEELTI